MTVEEKGVSWPFSSTNVPLIDVSEIVTVPVTLPSSTSWRYSVYETCLRPAFVNHPFKANKPATTRAITIQGVNRARGMPGPPGPPGVRFGRSSSGIVPPIMAPPPAYDIGGREVR